MAEAVKEMICAIMTWPSWKPSLLVWIPRILCGPLYLIKEITYRFVRFQREPRIFQGSTGTVREKLGVWQTKGTVTRPLAIQPWPPKRVFFP
jgi:hypothetical protein